MLLLVETLNSQCPTLSGTSCRENLYCFSYRCFLGGFLNCRVVKPGQCHPKIGVQGQLGQVGQTWCWCTLLTVHLREVTDVLPNCALFLVHGLTHLPIRFSQLTCLKWHAMCCYDFHFWNNMWVECEVMGSGHGAKDSYDAVKKHVPMALLTTSGLVGHINMIKYV